MGRAARSGWRVASQAWVTGKGYQCESLGVFPRRPQEWWGRTGCGPGPGGQPRLAPIQELEKQRYQLVPVRGKGQEVMLYDIFEGDEWRGSRRTAEQCATFLKTPLLLLD